MSTIDRLEAKNQFPKRVTLEATNRVAWPRREVMSFVRGLFRRRPPASSENHSDPPVAPGDG
jgi:predicted DNA-binding transcriptional regulator AlpA